MCIRDRSVSAYVSSLKQSNRPLPLVAAAILIAVSAVWGLNMVSIKISNPGLPPLHAVALRNSVAALVIGVWVYLRRETLFHRDRRLVPVSYTHLRAHETKANLVCRLLLEK